MPDVRYFTPAEAADVVPRLRPLLAALREAHHEQSVAREQVEDLRRLLGEAVFRPDHPESAEAARWLAQMRTQAKRVGDLLSEIHALGAQVKDPMMGLVDFYARRGSETVLLCYRDDEPTLAWWHPLTSGYAGRRPLSEF